MTVSVAQRVDAQLNSPQQRLSRLDIDILAWDQVVRCGDHAVEVGLVVS